MPNTSANSSPSRLLDPRDLSRLGRLDLIARSVVEGFLRGLHRSRFRGSSVEFAEHRPYTPGDDLARLDWRAFGKTDRLYLKDYEDETNLRATILLDASASMGFETQGISKFRYGCCLAASLGVLMIGQQDAVGLTTFDTDLRRIIPPKSSRQHLDGILTELDAAVPGGETNLGDVLKKAAEMVKGRGLVVLISDLLDDPGEILRGLSRFRFRDSDVLVFHVVDRAELEFPFQRWTSFRDLEDPSLRLKMDARWVRKDYLRNLHEHLRRLREGCRAGRMDYELIDTRTPFDVALAQYLGRRRSK